MMEMRNLHTHTVFCDGRDTPEELVLEAIAKGFDTLGFSGHSYTGFDTDCCMSESGTQEYCCEIARLKVKYAGRITILCGIEQDFYSEAPSYNFDYIIGSVHYILKNGEYFAVDDTPEIVISAAERLYGGDITAVAEDYYSTLSKMHDCNIIGHFDVVNKFSLFDGKNPRYTAAWQSAADILLKLGKPFEINTGAIARGLRTVPYPDYEMLDYIKEKGGRFILSSDCHAKQQLDFGFGIPELLKYIQ